MRCFQVKYEQKGTTWLADVNLFDECHDKIIGITPVLIRTFGTVSKVTILKEYSIPDHGNNPRQLENTCKAIEPKEKEVHG